MWDPKKNLFKFPSPNLRSFKQMEFQFVGEQKQYKTSQIYVRFVLSCLLPVPRLLHAKFLQCYFTGIPLLWPAMYLKNWHCVFFNPIKMPPFLLGMLVVTCT